ncbi:MAG: PAS domain S-box protein, partial [Chloroflexi bacterium]|nr:PAS domain S-box protein [Chloroflexota bacterium]
MAHQKQSAPKRAENAREKSPKGAHWSGLELYQTIVEHMAEAVAITVGDERVYVNPAYLRIHGLTDASEVLGKSMSLFMDADSRRAVNEARNARLRGEDVPLTIEYRIQRPDGERRVLEVTPANITYEGQPASLALIRDITARTRNVERLQMGNVIAENMAEGVSVAVGTERVYVSKAFAEIHGLEDEEEAIGQPIDQFIVSEDSGRVLNLWLARQRGEQVPDRVEYRIRRMTGEERVVETSTATITYQGQPAVLGIIRDITDRKVAEGQLAQSVELYQALFDRVPIGIGIADMEGNLITLNDAMLRPGGYTKEDIRQIGNVAFLYTNPQERAEALRLASEQGYLLHHEVLFKRKDGTSYDASLSLSPVTINGQPCWQAMVEDITERKRSAAALLQSEDLYRTVAENMAEGVSIAVDGKRIYVNKALLDIYGLDDASQALGKGIEAFMVPEIQQRVREEGIVRQNGGSAPSVLECRAVRTDGVERILEVTGTPITYQSQAAVLSIIRDVTEARQVAAALEQSEDLYRSVAENMTNGVSIAANGIRLYANQAFLNIHGLQSVSEAVGSGVEL